MLVLVGCKSSYDYLNTDLISENGNYRAVIEIPAGTNSKIEYDKNLKEFKPSFRNGEERTIDFLAYPANYGFIPSTYSDPQSGGDGDPLDILVLSSSLNPGDIVEVLPIAILKLTDNNEQDFKVIAIPTDASKQTIRVANYEEFVKKYDPARKIIETWFLNYDLQDDTVLLGWGDEKEAIREIERWRVKS